MKNFSAPSIISLSISIITSLHFSNSSADEVTPILPFEINLSFTLLFWLVVFVVSPLPVLLEFVVLSSLVIEVAKFSVLVNLVSGVSFTVFLLFAVVLLLVIDDEVVELFPVAFPSVILSSVKSLFNRKFIFCFSTSNSVLYLSFHHLSNNLRLFLMLSFSSSFDTLNH